MQDLFIGEPNSQKLFYPFLLPYLNELSKIRRAISIDEFMNCIESHYLALAEKIWKETNLQEVAQDGMFQTKFGHI